MKCILAVVWGFTLPLSAAPLAGTKTVGPNSADYPSLTAAIADIQTQSIGGALLLELQADYRSTVETFPLIFPSFNGASEVNTVTIRPASGASALSITSGDTTAATIDLNGARFVTFDGRSGGAGTVKQLSIANTSTSGRAVRFINDANSNVLRHLMLQSVNTSSTNGTVVFSTTNGANGNDNNLIDSCDLRDGASTPRNGIYALGSTTDTARSNSGNTVSNCNIFNFYGSSGDAAGVRLAAGNSDWTISGNSFYQTVTRAATSANLRAIYVSNTFGNNFTVSGNFIGGTAPNAGGTAWTTTGSAAYLFQGIRLNVGAITQCNVSANTIANMVWTSSSSASTLPGVWSGIFLEAGAADIGTGNTIGSGTGTGSIAVTTSGSGGTTFGIGSASVGTVAIENNIIGSITTSHTTTGAASLIGIQVTGGANTISNNIVGSTTTPNSLNATTSTSTITAQQVVGIIAFSSSSSAGITDNTVANLNNNHNSTAAGQILGIATYSGVNAITGNTVRNLSTASQVAGFTNPPSVIGISQSSTVAGQTVSRNIVHSLVNTAATADVMVTGIRYTGNTTNGPNLIARNLVHSLAIASTGTSSRLFGMYFDAGTFTAENNMVRVGLDASGASTAGASLICGLYEINGSANRNFYHNSVYLGGAQISGVYSTTAFASNGKTHARDYRNNIFVNARSNSGATIKHYAVVYNSGTAASPNPAGLTANNNLFLASGAGGILGLFNNADRSTLAAWQAATGQDVSSAEADPLFVNPMGDATAVDLHLQANNPAEGGGMPIASVNDDFDGQARGSLTPVDIGADSGNQTSTGDIYGPAIRYPLLTSGSTANRTLTGWATIEDNSGTVASGANAPRFYFKKATDADVFSGNTAADNGWKFVTATGSGGSYSFAVDYSLLNGGSVNVGDSIQYFVVAQDAANNLASSPAAATVSATPPVRNLNAKPGAGVNTYSIVAPLSGPVTVGPTGTYASFSGAGGLFAALNSSVLIGNLTVNITGDTTEDGSTVLTATMQDNYPYSFSVILQPDSATMRTISGSGASGLIRLSGAKRVTIDGSFGGSGRYLTFRNTNTSGPTITFIDDASNNTMRNCVVEGGSTSVMLFSTGITTGNDNNLVTGNQIRDRSDAANVPGYLVYSNGTSDTVANSNNTVSNNELFNFMNYGLLVLSGSESWNITGNKVFQTAPRTTELIGIVLNGLGTNTIRGNNVRDMTTINSATGIFLSSQTGNTTVEGNRIWNIGNGPESSGAAFGIYFKPGAEQGLTVANNMVVLRSVGLTAQNLYGICDNAATGSTVVTVHNTVLITGTGWGNDSWAYNNRGNSNAMVKNNVFLNLRTASANFGPNSCNHFAANRNPASSGSLTMDFNVYAGSGKTTAADFFDGSNGSASSGIPISYAQWQANVPGDIHSSAGNPGGSYTSAMFVDPANGDLHLIPGGNLLVNNTGTPIPNLATDFDGQLRSASQPYIGADELLAPANQPPLFSGYAVATTPNTAVEMGHAALLERASDPDSGILAIFSASANSAQGGTVTNTGGNITYSPPASYTGLDIFSITITDNQGGITPGIVIVNVTDTSVATDIPTQIAYFQNGGTVAVLFPGIPGHSYQIQRSTDLVNWSSIKLVTATSGGHVPFTDPNTSPGSAFYRISLP